MCYSSDLPGFDPTTLNLMVLSYRLMTKRSGLGESTKLSRVGLSHLLSSVITLLKGFMGGYASAKQKFSTP
jgi:hypothetical protein